MDTLTPHTDNTVALPLLPVDPRQALLELIKITQKLLDIADKEAQVLAQDDMLSFAILQDEKRVSVERYAKLCEEFHERVEEFRGQDDKMLSRLEDLQDKLGKKSRVNNQIVSEIYSRAKTKTQDTLLAAQEIAQGVHVKFQDSPAETSGDNS